jgi:Holliday junction resolvase
MPRINTIRKGNRTRREIIKWHQDNGYDVAIIERCGRYIKERDAFGIGDLLAIKGDEIKLIQSKTNSKEKKTQRLMEDFVKKHKNKNLVLELWNRIDYRGFKISQISYKDNIILSENYDGLELYSVAVELENEEKT